MAWSWSRTILEFTYSLSDQIFEFYQGVIGQTLSPASTEVAPRQQIKIRSRDAGLHDHDLSVNSDVLKNQCLAVGAESYYEFQKMIG